jgi:hypothetical protein
MEKKSKGPIQNDRDGKKQPPFIKGTADPKVKK